MTGKTHQVIGLGVGLATFLLATPPSYGPATLAAVLVGSHIAALLPDIDQPASSIWRSIPGGLIMGELSNPFLQHRNLTHSLLGMAIVAWGLHALSLHFPDYWNINARVAFVSWMAAYASHLVADMVTVQGIPLLFPIQNMMGFPPRPFQGIRIETGHWFENFVVFPLTNLAVLALVYWQWPHIAANLFHS